MRVGAAITPFHTDSESAVRLAVRGDELGYSDFGIAEGWTHDAPVLLARIAEVTSRIGLATRVREWLDAGADALSLVLPLGLPEERLQEMLTAAAPGSQPATDRSRT